MIECTLHLGDVAEGGKSYKSVALDLPMEFTPADIAAVLEAAKVRPVDVKTQATLDVANITAEQVVGLLSYFHGTSGRWLRLILDGEAVDTRTLTRAFPKVSRRVNSDVSHLYVADPQQVVRGVQKAFDARRVYITLPDNPTQAVAYFLALAGLRTTKDRIRLPLLAAAPIEEEPSRDELGSAQPSDFRQAGASFRTSHRLKSELHLLPGGPAQTTDRQQRLQKAAEVDIEKVMRALPKSRTEDGIKWHCPRPERHTNGDRNPSMRIDNNRTQCFRCDGEWVDSLRITVDSTGMSPDQAANWLLALAEN